MRICIPTQTDEGEQARVNAHFGSTPFFTIFDTETGKYEVLDNTKEHGHRGGGSPRRKVEEARAGAVICYGLGTRAFSGLSESGVKIYKARGRTVGEVIGQYQKGELAPVTAQDTCVHGASHHHDHDHDHGH